MLKVIGAGFSRTGTYSLKQALEAVGFGPCYHMHEVFGRPEHVALWANASSREPDWSTMFAGYASVADAPACHYWRQIRNAFPGAKVILTVRDADSWYTSFSATVLEAMHRPDLLPVSAHPTLAMARKLVLDEVFSGRIEDRAHAIAVYESHNRAVIDSVDAQRLLVYRVNDGWAPLCAFLEVPVPAGPFPATNARAQFRARLGLS